MPLLINTMPDASVIITEAVTQENVLEKMNPVIAERFRVQPPKPDFANASGQTELSWEYIERYRELWKLRIEEKQRREELKAKLKAEMKKMKEIQRLIEQSQNDVLEKDSEETLLKAKMDAVKAQQAARIGINIKDPSKAKKEAAIREEVRKRQTELSALDGRNKSLEERLAELQKIKNMLTDDINDMDHRHKPEVRRVPVDVSGRKVRTSQSTARLKRVKQNLEEKRRDFETAQSWQTSHCVRDLRLTRFKLERRQSKWRSLLKNPSTEQNLERFSAANAQRRESLSEKLQQVESDHVDDRETLDELAAYSDLLTSLINEHLAHWNPNQQ
jgi:DNA repair exonuclease SbcCD ATPase subunit